MDSVEFGEKVPEGGAASGEVFNEEIGKDNFDFEEAHEDNSEMSFSETESVGVENVPEEVNKEMSASEVFGRDGETDPVWNDGERVCACAVRGQSGGAREGGDHEEDLVTQAGKIISERGKD